jgi:hypothetical protein
MKRTRRIYFIVICGVISLGLASRQIGSIPLFIGDILWAVMIFFITRFLFLHTKVKTLVILSLAICYLVEISQLYQAEWIHNIRATLLGRLVLGQGFSWGDLISYTVGTAFAAWIESVFMNRMINKQGNTTTN